MSDMPQISDAEWEVMNVLWERSPLTASEVLDELATRKSWHPKTLKTFLGRLVKKGALSFEAEGNRYFYTPSVSRERYVPEESRSFLDRVFGGNATPMLVHFVRTTKLTEAEINELRGILERKQEES